MTRHLRVVASQLVKAPETAPATRKDIYAADKAKIAETDWNALHIASDRRAPIDLTPSRPFRRLLGFGTRTQRGNGRR